jgi:hypothetical protein
MRLSPSGSRARSAGGSIRKTATSLLSASALALVAPRAHAAEPPRIVLVTNHADATIVPLLRAELRSLGVEVVEVPKSEEEVLPADLSAAARSAHAVAAFRVLVSGRKVEVWIADRATGKVVLRETFAEGEDGKVDERVVIVQAMELLRASLMELDAPHPPRVEEPAAPALATAVGAVPVRERFLIDLAPAVFWSPGGALPSLGASAALAVRATWIGAGVFAGTTVMPARLVRSIGTAEMTTRWIGGEILAMRPPGESPWKPRGGIGVAAVFTGLHGIAVAPRPSSDDSVITVAPTFHADLGYAVTRNIRLTLGGAVLVPIRYNTIVFAGEDVGTYGRVLVVGSLGLGAVIP